MVHFQKGDMVDVRYDVCYCPCRVEDCGMDLVKAMPYVQVWINYLYCIIIIVLIEITKVIINNNMRSYYSYNIYYR